MTTNTLPLSTNTIHTHNNQLEQIETALIHSPKDPGIQEDIQASLDTIPIHIDTLEWITRLSTTQTNQNPTFRKTTKTPTPRALTPEQANAIITVTRLIASQRLKQYTQDHLVPKSHLTNDLLTLESFAHELDRLQMAATTRHQATQTIKQERTNDLLHTMADHQRESLQSLQTELSLKIGQWAAEAKEAIQSMDMHLYKAEGRLMGELGAVRAEGGNVKMRAFVGFCLIMSFVTVSTFIFGFLRMWR